MAPWLLDNGTATTYNDSSSTDNSLYYYGVDTGTTSSATVSYQWTSANQPWHDWQVVPNQVAEQAAREEYAQQNRELSEAVQRGVEEMAAERARREREETARIKSVESAQEKADKLLREIVGETMWNHYKKNGFIDVDSLRRIEVRYRIRPYRMIGLLKKDKDGRWVEENRCLCIHPREQFVEGDDVLTKLMLCRNDEGLLWRVANVHNGMRAA